MSERHAIIRGIGFLYLKAWRPFYAVLAAITSAIAVGIVRARWGEDMPTEVGTVAVVIGVFVAYFEIEAIGRWVGATDAPLIDLRNRLTWIVLIGYGFAFALAMLFAIGAVRGMEGREQRQAQREREQQERRERFNSPEVQRGMEAYEAAKRRREAREAASTQPN